MAFELVYLEIVVVPLLIASYFLTPVLTLLFETEGTVAEVSALAHMFGRDFEVYLSEDGNSPNQIMVSYNKLTNEEPIMLWLKGTE